MQRRQFLRNSTATLITALGAPLSWAEPHADTPSFQTANDRWQTTYDKALKVLEGNVQILPRYDLPVLIEGAEYPGVWQECGPFEALVYRHFRPDVARNGHMVFFALQRPDGQLPAAKKRSDTGYGQIQMVVPIAATAWELAQATGDEQLLQKAYEACSRWDEWLMRYRNTRRTGLVEGFCTYDTGHDNSPRWAGVPNRCPDADARKCPAIEGVPRLCPDLSATVFGARNALAAMARALHKDADAMHWDESAQHIRQLILDKLFDPADRVFYDLDAKGKFVRVRSDLLSRVCGEHVLDQKAFEDLWSTLLHNPDAFWGKYPLASIAMDDPTFVRPIPRNSWGGASQALTALRAPRWMELYGKSAELSFLMNQWCEAIQRDSTFRQQMDPLTGDFTQASSPGYSPAALVMMDFTWRLSGVREEREELEWNVRPDHPSAQQARFSMTFGKSRNAALNYRGMGAELRLDGKVLGHIEGGAARLVTDKKGNPLRVVGISESNQRVTLRLGRHPARRIQLAPNEHVQLAQQVRFPEGDPQGPPVKPRDKQERSKLLAQAYPITYAIKI